MPKKILDIVIEELDDLPKPFREMAECLGVEAVLQLAAMYEGQSVYFPMHETLIKQIRYRQIYQEYMAGRGGDVYARIARKHGYSESHVRRIIKICEAEKRKPPEQLEMFGGEP